MHLQPQRRELPLTSLWQAQIMADPKPPSRKLSWTDAWNARSAVGKRLGLQSTQTRIKLAIMFFLFGPLVGSGLIIIGWENYLWVLGAPILALSLLGWVLAPFVAAIAILYVLFVTIRDTIAPASQSDPTRDTATLATGDEGLAELGPSLAKLARLQGDIAARRRSALLSGIPVAAAVSLAVAYAIVTTSGFNLLALVMGVGLPLLFGIMFVTRPFESEFRQAFKTEVLPVLLQRHGDLVRRAGARMTFSRAMAMGVIARHESIYFDDVFAGMYRGESVEIADMVLVSPRDGEGRPKTSKAHHRVLAISLTLPRPVPATTAVLDLRRRKKDFQAPAKPLERLDLEDVVFSSVYEVYATDQIGGRVLLSPAVMRRLVEIADGHEFLPPTVLAHDGVLQVFLATYNERDFFEPGRVSRSDMAAHVRTIDKDLVQVFAILDDLLTVAGTLTTPLFAEGTHPIE